MICGREICPNPLRRAATGGEHRLGRRPLDRFRAGRGHQRRRYDHDKKQHKIRINGIDAPEKRQAFGEESRQSLAQWRTERMPGVGLAQISVGLAWWFSRYANEQSPEDRGRYKSAEGDARLRKRGL
jgi:endonuclease YncB( thermonuclease family)